MSSGINKKRGTLSARLTGTYAAMSAIVLVALSVMIFAVAHTFLVNKQKDNLITTMELTVDHIIEELHEGEGLSERGILEEQNNNGSLNIYLFDVDGVMVNRTVNFHLDSGDLPTSANAPELRFAGENQMLLFYEQPVTDEDGPVGSLLMALNMQTEQEFLKMLGMLLIFANIVGGACALIVGRHTSKRLLAPIDSMIADAQNIGSRSLDARMEVPEADDELRKLALTVNGMLSRIEKAFEVQGRFAADASHELRTPLAVLRGNADLLARWGKSDEKILDESIASISRQTDYMNKLVENLLFLARSDGGRHRLNRESFAVGDLFLEIVEEQAVIDGEHTYSIDCEPNVMLNADRSMIKQLLHALTDNSAKYTGAGGSISLSAISDDNYVTITVKDTGRGMDREHLTHIFERFYRVDKARARATGGMGLGLSIAEAIVEVHNGSISAQSEAGKGTAVSAVFPAK